MSKVIGDGGTLGSVQAGGVGESKGDLEEGLLEPLLGSGDVESSGERKSNDRQQRTASSGEKQDDGQNKEAEIPPAPFLDLFFFADKVCAFLPCFANFNTRKQQYLCTLLIMYFEVLSIEYRTSRKSPIFSCSYLHWTCSFYSMSPQVERAVCQRVSSFVFHHSMKLCEFASLSMFVLHCTVLLSIGEEQNTHVGVQISV